MQPRHPPPSFQAPAWVFLRARREHGVSGAQLLHCRLQMGLLRGSFLPCLPSMQAEAARSGSFLHVTWHCEEEGDAGGWEELSFGSVPAGWLPEVWAVWPEASSARAHSTPPREGWGRSVPEGTAVRTSEPIGMWDPLISLPLHRLRVPVPAPPCSSAGGAAFF